MRMPCNGVNGVPADEVLRNMQRGAGVEARLDLLANAATLTEMIAQMTNTAPPLLRLGIPAYQVLPMSTVSVAVSRAAAAAL